MEVQQMLSIQLNVNMCCVISKLNESMNIKAIELKCNWKKRLQVDDMLLLICTSELYG